MRQLRLLMLTGIILALCYAVPRAIDKVAPNLLTTTSAPSAPPTPNVLTQTQLAQSVAGAFKAVQGIVATGAAGVAQNRGANIATPGVTHTPVTSPTPHTGVASGSKASTPAHSVGARATATSISRAVTPTQTTHATPTATVPTATIAPATPQGTSVTSKKLAVRVGTTLYVGNTGGDGVYLRKSPDRTARIRAWADNTPMVVVGPDSQGIGNTWTWKHVRAPDGQIGWIPAQYLVTQS